MKDKVTLEQLKNIFKKEYLEKIKNLDDGEVLSFFLMKLLSQMLLAFALKMK